MNYSFDNLGSIPSPKDKRDFKLDRVIKLVGAAEIIPESYFTNLSKLPVLYQGKQPACIGHATASGMMAEDDGAYSFDYSPRFIYALCKRDDGIPEVEGTYYRQGFKESQLYGVCDNTQHPNDIELDKRVYKDAFLISSEAFRVAQDRKVKSYVALNDLSFEGIKKAIYQSGVVLLGVHVGREWWTDINGNGSWQEKDILPLRPPKVRVSGHAILAYGYDKDYIYFRNSFSRNWGRNGDGYLGRDYASQIYEGWTFIDLAPEVVAELKKKLTLLQQLLTLYQKLLELMKGRQ